MKIKFLFLSILSWMLAGSALAADDVGLRAIQTRGKVFCGTDLNIDTYAHKNDDGTWEGIDVDFCRAIAAAATGNAENFEMKHVDISEVGKALKAGTIDVMLGFAPYSASVEFDKQYAIGGLMYYDRQMFLAADLDGAKSMEAFKGKRVCTVQGSEDLSHVQEYSNRYALDLQVHFYKSERDARNAFLMKRCELLTGNEKQLKGILDQYGQKSNITLIPEAIAVKPVYAFVDFDNASLRMAVRWALNALALAESKGITSKNVDLYTVDDNTSIKNLLGQDEKLWRRINIQPGWLKPFIKLYGNYREIIDRNFKEPLKENMLNKDGGGIIPMAFI